MSGVFRIKRNDTSPAIRITCTDADGTAVDLTGATVRFHMRKATEDAADVDAAATIVTAASGIVEYQWAAADTAASGSWRAEFEVTYADASVETFPNVGYITVKIGDDLA